MIYWTNKENKRFLLILLSIALYPNPSKFLATYKKTMAISYSDKEVAKNIGYGDKARLLGKLAGTFAFYRDKNPHLYAILACHPGITDGQRTIVLKQRWDPVKEHLMDVDRKSLDITFEESWVIIHSEDFITLRDAVANQLGIELLQIT